MFCISKGLNYNWRLSPEKLKNYLIDNNWVVSDIILKTTRKVPLPNKSADENVFLISPGTDQSANFIFESHSSKEALLRECFAIYFLIVCSFIK